MARYSIISVFVLMGCLAGFSATTSAQQQDPPPRHDPREQRVEPFQVFDNLYYVGARWVSAWVIETSEGLVVIDTLYGELTDFVTDGIRELGMDPSNIRHVIVTHAHYDHVGGARRLQDEYGGIVYMTDEAWERTAGEPVYRDYPQPQRNLSVSDGNRLNLGDTQLRLFQTPGHTPGTLSIQFSVSDDGRRHTALMFGGAGLNFSGVERTQTYIESVERLMQLEGLEVLVPNHPDQYDLFERRDRLQQRESGDPHPMVDPEAAQGWLEELRQNAQQKLEEERADSPDDA